MATPSLQVVQQRGNHSREKQKQGSSGGEQSPIPPGHMEGGLIEAAKHGGPEVALKFEAANGVERILQELFEVDKFWLIHAWTPACDSDFRKTRTPRNTRTLTALSEIPRALAIFS